MANKGKLYLIPNTIADDTVDKVVTPQLREILPSINFFLAENVRTARRFLSSLKIYESIEALRFEVLDKDTSPEALKELIAPAQTGQNIGIISESGCPGVADPGALAARYAHEHDIRVIPIVGPSSILLGLMASGLNGQKFAFNGYLPIDGQEAAGIIRAYEKESRQKNQTQIFIETPYRNNTILQHLLKNLSAGTLLTIAVDITGPAEMIKTRKISEWQSLQATLPKSPAVFMFLA